MLNNRPDAASGRGYLANIQPSQYHQNFDHILPDTMTGEVFLNKYESHMDSATTVNTSTRQVPFGHIPCAGLGKARKAAGSLSTADMT